MFIFRAGAENQDTTMVQKNYYTNHNDNAIVPIENHRNHIGEILFKYSNNLSYLISAKITMKFYLYFLLLLFLESLLICGYL